MLKGKNQVTLENIEMYKELYEARENLTDEDIKRICKHMVIALGLGFGFSCLFPPSIFVISFVVVLAATYGITVKEVHGIIHRKERKLMLKYSHLDVSMDNEELLRQIQLVEQTKRKGNAKGQIREVSSFPNTYIPTDEKNKVLVKKRDSRIKRR